MKIELIKLKFNDTYSYKYKPFKYCCDKIHQNKCIVFTNEDLTYYDNYKDDIQYIPQFCTSRKEIFKDYEDEWEQIDNYPIQFCPHCGEKIEIKVVNEMDVSEKYKKLINLRKELSKKCQKTDSKKIEAELSKQIKELDNQINGFYVMNEYQEDLYV